MPIRDRSTPDRENPHYYHPDDEPVMNDVMDDTSPPEKCVCGRLRGHTTECRDLTPLAGPLVPKCECGRLKGHAANQWCLVPEKKFRALEYTMPRPSDIDADIKLEGGFFDE